MSDSPHTSPSTSPIPGHPDNRGDADDTSMISSRADSGIGGNDVSQSQVKGKLDFFSFSVLVKQSIRRYQGVTFGNT
jgi:hypothetical protein